MPDLETLEINTDEGETHKDVFRRVRATEFCIVPNTERLFHAINTGTGYHAWFLLRMGRTNSWVPARVWLVERETFRFLTNAPESWVLICWIDVLEASTGADAVLLWEESRCSHHVATGKQLAKQNPDNPYFREFLAADEAWQRELERRRVETN